MIPTPTPMPMTKMPLTQTPVPSQMPKKYPVVNNKSNVELSKIINMNELGVSNAINVRDNIIYGPNLMSYWNHSPGMQKPEYREEGPFPVQGNIGSLLAEETINQFNSCSQMVDGRVIPDVSGSPNCAGTFRADVFTKMNTCGSECQLKYPEIYGEKDFGYPKSMKWNDKITNAHQIHAYQNIRAMAPGQGPDLGLGAEEWIPRTTIDTNAHSGILNEQPEYAQVGEWNKLPMYKNITKINYS